MTSAFISHPACFQHDMGAHHPECPQRLQAITAALCEADLYDKLQHYDAPRATRAQLLRVHTADYLDRIERQAPTQGMAYLDPDTAMNPYSLEAALRASGAVVLATDLVLRGEVDNAFCAVRPPGHHAGANFAMGFCIFNNVAVGAAHALAEYKLERVAIVDFDVHHGNGTEHIFRDEPRVLLCSSFQHPFYPHSGAQAGPHYVAMPLPSGTQGGAFRRAMQADCFPALREFKPQVLFISAGFDAHTEDELAGLNLIEADYAWVTRELKAIAQETADGKIVSVLEGGYALAALGRSVVAHIAELQAAG